MHCWKQSCGPLNGPRWDFKGSAESTSATVILGISLKAPKRGLPIERPRLVLQRTYVVLLETWGPLRGPWWDFKGSTKSTQRQCFLVYPSGAQARCSHLTTSAQAQAQSFSAPGLEALSTSCALPFHSQSFALIGKGHCGALLTPTTRHLLRRLGGSPCLLPLLAPCCLLLVRLPLLARAPARFPATVKDGHVWSAPTTCRFFFSGQRPPQCPWISLGSKLLSRSFTCALKGWNIGPQLRSCTSAPPSLTVVLYFACWVIC